MPCLPKVHVSAAADRTLIVRENGARMPADLAGSIFVPFSDRNRLGDTHTPIWRFLQAQL